MGVYLGFNSFDDVMGTYEVSIEEQQGVTILYADYECGNYEGWSFVLFEKDGKLYEVNGSHCSCYGLEGQWGPEEVLIEELLRRKSGDEAIVEILTLIQKIGIDATVVAIRLMQ